MEKEDLMVIENHMAVVLLTVPEVDITEERQGLPRLDRGRENLMADIAKGDPTQIVIPRVIGVDIVLESLLNPKNIILSSS